MENASKKRDIVCVSYTTWEGRYTKSVVQILSRLALTDRILFVEYPFTYKDIIYGILGKIDAPYLRMIGWKKRMEVKKTDVGSEVMTFVAPPVFPSNFIKNRQLFKLVNDINVWIFTRSLKNALSKLGMEEPVVVNAFNCYFGWPMLGRLNEKGAIYYCYDGMSTEMHGERALVYDEEFSKRASGVIVTSDHLLQEKMRWNPKTFLVKNGVDIHLFLPFAKSNPRSTDRKKVGYIGSIDERFDIETVEFAIQKMPGVDFELIGDLRNMEVYRALSKYPNVQFGAAVASTVVPELLSKCDVGMIPYRMNEVNKNIYPLKINEYLAVGVPVVLNRFASLPEFEGLVSFVENREEFVRCLQDELENDSSVRISKRIEFAKMNSWEQRTEQFSKAIDSIVFE